MELLTLGVIATTTAAFVAVCMRRHAMGASEFLILFALLCAQLRFAVGSTAEPFANSFSRAFSDIVAIPDAVKTTILPGFERLLAATKLDPTPSQTLSRTAYESDPDLQKDGTLDDASFLKLAHDYKHADDALTAMRDYDKTTYALLTNQA